MPPMTIATACWLFTMTAGCHLVLGYDGDASEGDGGRDAVTSGGAAGSVGGSDGGGGNGGAGAAGGAIGGGGIGGVGGSQGGAGGCVDVEESDFSSTPATGVSDDFSSINTSRGRWGARFLTQNEGGFDDSACTARLCNGELLLFPGQPQGGQQGYFWSGAQSGPVIYQRVTGDFAMEVAVHSEHSGGTRDVYTGAGIIVRNPNVVSHWSQYRLGTGSAKNGRGTFHRWHNGVSDPVKQTSFVPATARQGRLLVCRIAGSFSHHRKFEEDATTKTAPAGGTLTLQMEMVDTLEVGVSVVWFAGQGLGAVGRYDHVTFHPPPATHTACAGLL